MADSQRKTANLWNYTFTSGYNLDTTTGIPTTYGNQSRMATLTPINVSAYDNVVFNFTNTTTNILYAMYSTIKNGTLVNRVANIQPPFIIDVSNADEIYFCIYNVSSADSISNDSITNAMLNEGSPALPYEPYGWLHSLRKLTTATDTLTTLPAVVYGDGTNATVGISGNTVQTGTPTPDNPIQPQGCGDLETVGAKAGQFKIPISSANTTTPVYLGEVESTRKIKKLVLTGEESWGKNDTAISGATIFTRTINDGLTGYTPFCTHYAGSNSTTWASLPTNSVTVSVVSGGVQRLAINVGASYSEIIDFKSYLAAQYANGTPVTVWYVLATPETAVVNEPLMKIGDYADTVSGITIPTITGKDTFDVETTLKPSEVSLSYTGWHDASVKERDGSQWD